VGLPTSSIMRRMVPPWTLPAGLASSGSMSRAVLRLMLALAPLAIGGLCRRGGRVPAREAGGSLGGRRRQRNARIWKGNGGTDPVQSSPRFHVPVQNNSGNYPSYLSLLVGQIEVGGL